MDASAAEGAAGQAEQALCNARRGAALGTLEKMLAHSRPPGYRRKKSRGRKIDPYVGWIEEVLKADRNVPRKQRHTAKRIYERLGREKGYEGGYTAVKEVVARLRARRREVFVPLEHRPGEAQVDFGHALVKEADQLRMRPFFAMRPALQ